MTPATPRRPATGRAVPALALALALASGCQSMDAAAPPTLADSQWIARSINGQPVADGVSSTVEFEGTTAVAGSTGCNRYRGEVTIDGGALAFGPLATTRRACLPPQMDQERRFTQALRATTAWQRDGDDLAFLDDRGDVRLRLQPLPPATPPTLP